MKTKKPPFPVLEIGRSRKAAKSTTSSPSKNPVALKRSSVPKNRQFHTPAVILRRLDIDPEEVRHAPPVTDVLVRCLGGSEKRPPKQQVINFLSASNDEGAKAYLASCRSIPKSDLSRLTIEAICVHAQVNPLQVLGAVLASAKSMKAMESALKSILSHPDVVEATVQTAKLIGPAGTADRRLMHEAIGFLPTRKGGGVEINFFGKPKDDGDDESDDEEKAWDEAFPLVSANLEAWSGNRRALTDGK